MWPWPLRGNDLFAPTALRNLDFLFIEFYLNVIRIDRKLNLSETNTFSSFFVKNTIFGSHDTLDHSCAESLLIFLCKIVNCMDMQN